MHQFRQIGLVIAAVAWVTACSDATSPRSATTARATVLSNHSQSVTPIDLGDLPGGAQAAASDVDFWFDATGAAEISNRQDEHAFRWTPTSGMQDLGNLGGRGPGVEFSAGNRIAQLAGSIVGSANTASGAAHAFLWTAFTGMQDLGTVGGGFSSALGIDDFGEIVVGTSSDASGLSRAFIWTPRHGMRTITTVSQGSCVANGVNSRGVIVGSCTNVATSVARAFVIKGGSFKTLPNLGGTFDIAWNVNDDGTIVGQSALPSGDSHAVIWGRHRTIRDLGTLGGPSSQGLSINDVGEVVGGAVVVAGRLPHAFRWTKSTGMQDLDVAGDDGSFAFGVNITGFVAGTNIVGPFQHALLWPPDIDLLAIASRGQEQGSRVAPRSTGDRLAERLGPTRAAMSRQALVALAAQGIAGWRTAR